MTKLLFQMPQSSAIVGRITDEDGEPVAGVEVEALAKASKIRGEESEDDPMPLSRSEFVPVGQAMTNDLGDYRVHSIPPGEYYVAAIDSGMPTLTEENLRGSFGVEVGDEPSTNHPPVYYPGVSQRSQAQRIRITAGQEVRVDVSLRPEKTFTVSGRVLDQNGKPAAGIYVRLQPEELETFFSALRNMGNTDAKGHFSVAGVTAGSYMLQAEFHDETGTYSAEQKLEVAGENVSTLEARLSRELSIVGRVTTQESLSIDFKNLHVWLSPLNGDSWQWGAADVKKDGSFKADSIRKGVYSVHVTGLPEGWYLRSANFGGDDVFKHGIRAGTSATLDLTLSPAAAELSGTVTVGDKLVPGAQVKLVPEESTRYRKSLGRTTSTAQNGRFIFQNLVPGNYWITGLLSESDEEDGGNGAAAAGENNKLRVTLAERDKKSVQLDLQLHK
jgi:Carboxypeptidase regulatory-like domain